VSVLTLLLQIAVILVAARAVGALCRLVGQPQVVGEMAAGIALGPSLLGWLAPGASAFLFPAESLVGLQVLSQVGLVLFMFLVGLELDPKLLRGRGETAVLTSHTSIVIPFLLGSALALYLYPHLSDASVSFTEFALFMGAAMSVTAFPVLARILTERNLLRTKVGAITIACAAVDDVTAWCILAAVVALVRATGMESVLLTLGGSVVYVGLMLLAVRPVLRKLETYYESRGRLTEDAFAAVLLALLLSAWATEFVGIHALFGAFFLGAIMPKEKGFVREVSERLEWLTVVFLLPLFFAYTGLRTQIGLLDEPRLWAEALLVLGVAVAGKFGGSALAARLTGLGWREAGALGILMNTRGLMELVILTIGLDLGVISPAVFVMMVLMALATTVMTTPVLEAIYSTRLIRRETLTETDEAAFTVLIPVALPSSGPTLLRMAQALAPAGTPRVYALHLQRADDARLAGPDAAEDGLGAEALAPLLAAAEGEDVAVRPLAFVSRDVGDDITATAHLKGADLVLMGWHKPILSQSVLGGAVYDVMRRTRADVAVFLARKPAPWRRVLVPYTGGVHDRAALRLADRLGQRPGTAITILHVVAPSRGPDAPRLGLSGEAAEAFGPSVQLKVVEREDAIEAAVEEARAGYDLVVIGASETWGLEPTLFSPRHERLAQACPASLLIVRADPSKNTPASGDGAAAFQATERAMHG
jgi:Kef-type K+ transport system membrane component KefB